ncbi:hypothetical protein [Lelliottia sp.]|uniref:hypothetical protein n=1 Tax=Lelliottia sp. TaxID=1898429 RepID=UPI0038900D29
MDLKIFKKSCDQILLEGNIKSAKYSDAHEQIYQLCKLHIDEVSRKIRFLIKQTIFEHICHNAPLRPYIDILCFLSDAVREKADNIKSVAKAEDSEFKNWKNLISNAITARSDSHFFKDGTDHLSSHNKEVEFSRSCERLIKHGVFFECHDDNIFINLKSHDLVSNKIDSYVKRIGGLNVLEMSFKILTNIYNEEQERYYIYRKTTQGMEWITPEIPWGYIIALGAKNCDKPGELSQLTMHNEFQSFINFIKDVVSTFEIQPYVVWEAVFVDKMKTISFLQDNVLYDNLISFFQLKGEYAKSIINGLNEYTDFRSLDSYGYKLQDIIKVGIGLIDISSKNKINILTTEDIKEVSKVSRRKAAGIIDTFFLMKNKTLNLGFPPSSEEIDHILTPLVPLKGKYLSLPKCITSLSVINVILNQISKPNGSFNNAKDSLIGNFLESFLWDKLSKSGITCYRGDFKSKDKKISGDCDLLIKSEKFIYIFEIKKKSLTRKAMSGTDYQLIKDLGDSLMRSQSQCAKIEYVLLNDGELSLEHKKTRTKSIITHDKQRVVKISLSLHDFGALQDTIILSTVLKLSLQVQFNTDDPSKAGYLEKWKEYVETFTNYSEKVMKLKGESEIKFFGNIFMSIPQLFTILDDCHDENEFSDICNSSQHMTYSTRDFYKEYSEMKKLKNYSQNEKVREH